MRAFTRSIASLVLAFAVACPVAVTDNSLWAQPAAKKGKALTKAGPPPRTPFTSRDEEVAVVPGIPDARFWADSEQEFAKALPPQKGPWLALSAGGSDGAYGAGLLSGWSASGKRPEFAVVTGVSSGALMAPYAFLGSRYDDQLRDAFSSITAADVFEAGATQESLLDTWPLREVIAKRVTPKLLEDIAAEHARGRRFFVLTTNIDSERFVVWNMGAIASAGGEKALKLFRDVLVAASSVPGMFPPGYIAVEANGKRYQEMHADGGIGTQFFVAPELLLTSFSTYNLPATDLYVIVNGKLTPEFQVGDRSTVAILGRSVGIAIKAAARVGIDRAYMTAKRSGVGFHLAYIDTSFTQQSRMLFDPEYIKALFLRGHEHGKSGTAFLAQPPDLSNRPPPMVK